MNDQRSPDPRNVVFATLAGRVAIVTGAGQGLGRAFAKAFAATGAVAVIAERNGERGEAVAAEIAAAGGRNDPDGLMAHKAGERHGTHQVAAK